MARGTSAGSGRVSMSDDPKGPNPSAANDKEAKVTSMKAPQSQDNSARTTTAPSVKMPPVQMVTNATPRTVREKAVDSFNADVNRGDYQTAYERQLGRLAVNQTGAETKMIGRSKQAQ